MWGTRGTAKSVIRTLPTAKYNLFSSLTLEYMCHLKGVSKKIEKN